MGFLIKVAEIDSLYKTATQGAALALPPRRWQV
jgi:hypothetical protein